MKAVKAIYQNGRIKLSEKPEDPGPMEVVVVFSEPSDDLWERILSEKTPRPSFARFAQKCLEEIHQGKAKPLRLKDL
jgi:hypothetical protein